jgi:hypothetical protein
VTSRDRIRKWLGIESDVALVRSEAITIKDAIQRDVQNMINVAIQDVNKLGDSFGNNIVD